MQSAKMLGFPDLAGRWRRSLAFVMSAALAIGWVVFPRVAKLPESVPGGALRLPADSLVSLAGSGCIRSALNIHTTIV